MLKLLTILVAVVYSHPVHVSMSSLYEKGDNNLELSIRMYSDDLALDLYRLYNAEGIYSEKDHLFIFTGSDSCYQRYADDHLKIFVNGKLAEKELVEKKVVDLETILRFRIDISPVGVNSIAVENRILIGMYQDQVNLFIFKALNSEKGVKFTRDKTKEIFDSL